LHSWHSLAQKITRQQGIAETFDYFCVGLEATPVQDILEKKEALCLSCTWKRRKS